MKHLIKILIKSQLAIGLLLILNHPLKAQDDVSACSAYGKVGQTIAEVMLPMKVQDLITFINGSNPELEQEIVVKLLSNMTSQDFAALNAMNNESRELLFEMAGVQAIETLMQGKAATSQAVGERLYQQCTKEGVNALVERMRQANTQLDI